MKTLSVLCKLMLKKKQVFLVLFMTKISFSLQTLRMKLPESGTELVVHVLMPTAEMKIVTLPSQASKSESWCLFSS